MDNYSKTGTKTCVSADTAHKEVLKDKVFHIASKYLKAIVTQETVVQTRIITRFVPSSSCPRSLAPTSAAPPLCAGTSTHAVEL